MTTVTQLKLQKATFRGIDFLWVDSNTSGGRKTVTHEFPNTDRRFVEDLGLMKDQFAIEVVISGARSLLDIVRLNDYYTWRDSFKRALDTQGPGTLIHPFYGRKNVSIVSYNINESLNEIGLARIGVVFQESQPNIYPNQSGDNSGIINRGANSGIGSIADNIRNSLNIARLTKANLSDLIGKGRMIGNTFEGIKGKFSSGTGLGDALQESIDAFQNNSPQIVSDPNLFGDEIENIFNNSNSYGDEGEERFDIAKDTFLFGDDDINIQIPTFSANQQIETRALVNETIQSGGLIQAYRNVPIINFEDDEKIAEFTKTLEEQFEKFEEYTTISDETSEIVRGLRVQVAEFFLNVSATAFRIEDIKTEEVPMQVLVHQYYGNLDNFDRISELNPNQEVSFTEGSVKLLSR